MKFRSRSNKIADRILGALTLTGPTGKHLSFGTITIHVNQINNFAQDNILIRQTNGTRGSKKFADVLMNACDVSLGKFFKGGFDVLLRDVQGDIRKFAHYYRKVHDVSHHTSNVIGTGDQIRAW